jgi:hypothetical protein
LLTFDEWRNVWDASGKWAERGLARHQYRMARLDKRGAFEIGNVQIVMGSGVRRGRDNLRRSFTSQASAARKRGIQFLLTYEEWLHIWQKSGRLGERGRLPGQYCMARFGDAGSYELSNVRICLVEENHAERNRIYKRTPQRADNPWAGVSASKRRDWGKSISLALKGKPKSDHMRAALTNTITGRRRVTRNGRRTWAYPGDEDYPA